MSTPDAPPVRLVLDRSALLAYVSGSVHVGETLHEVITDGVRFGVTAVTAAETLAVVDDGKDRAALRRLLALDACAVLPTDAGSWQELAYWRRFTGRADLASTVLACLTHDAPILSGEPRYGDGDLPVIALPD
ncbi:PIN domain-containing protein [Micromonospora sp. DR5-3]|uniref:PIN domain-containing protein n=1 Tax=unclassified Micromonospora TaxID=2617518 RepID=UPI0011D970BF|nr:MULTISPECIES: PIN domain-containing protein [unclassified Micromonospora]MCW3820011.1 PIN domain-containing protein [Micromonospora sp. DR5-3]TYC20258.1 PIN domain-containing protein [Micromonospora sp. MP36]